jgi:ketosteroid isomerase-like protein
MSNEADELNGPSSDTVERSRQAFENSVGPDGRLNFDVSKPFYHEDVEYRESADWPDGGVYKGIDAYEAYWRQFDEQVELTTTEVDELVQRGNKLLAYLHFTGHQRGTDVPVDLQMAVVFTWRGEKVALVEGFLDRAHALEHWRSVTGEQPSVGTELGG